MLDGKKRYGDLLRRLARTEASPPEYRGEPARVIPLSGPLTLGCDSACDVVLRDDSIAPRHAVIESWPEGFAVHDSHSTTGTFVNGRSILWSGLRPGDLLQFGPYLFQFKKTFLLWLRQPAALTLAAVGLRHAIGEHLLLDDISLVARPGEFIGLLGPSGSGKTTLLNALSGLVPAGRGQVLLNGANLYDHPDRWRRLIGYVPQEDIVHLELTARQAFAYAARLRLPTSTPREERAALIDKTLSLLELDMRADLPVRLLSGGQRKRVSVGVELLGQPRLLFLDEPTSGLDPSTEAKLMRTLRDLAHQGRTVLCTTHIMENIDLFDRIAVLAPGGKLAYFGPPEEAQSYFEVERFSQIYDRLEQQPADQWRETFLQSQHAWALRQDIAGERQPRPFHQQDRPEDTRPVGGFAQWSLLTCRFARTLFVGRLPLQLLAQPVVIGGLVATVFQDLRPVLFLLVITTLWFGCSLAAQQIVKERAIVRRERRVNLDWLPYLASKFILLFALTFLQALVMWALVGAILDLPGELAWQMASLALAAANGVAFGLFISAFAQTADSATGAVPLTLVPQIVLAGLMLPLSDMNRPTYAAAEMIPARWSYQIMEAAWMQGRRIDVDLFRGVHTAPALSNLYPEYDFKNPEERQRFLDDKDAVNLDLRGTVGLAVLALLLLAGVQLGGLLTLLVLTEK